MSDEFVSVWNGRDLLSPVDTGREPLKPWERRHLPRQPPKDAVRREMRNPQDAPPRPPRPHPLPPPLREKKLGKRRRSPIAGATTMACHVCGVRPKSEGRNTCEQCRAHARKTKALKEQRRRELGVCTSCGRYPPAAAGGRCRQCMNRLAILAARRRKKLKQRRK